MRFPSLVVLLVVSWSSAVPALAGGLEIEAAIGRAVPTYTQTYSYFPRISGLNIPRLGLEQRGSFVLDARGGGAWTVAASLYFVDSVGVEARLDSAQIDAGLEKVVFDVTATLPPLPPVAYHFDLPSGAVRVDAVRPLSLNLKLRTPGRVALTFSAGASYLGELNAEATQPLGLGVAGLVGGRPELSTLALRASTRAANAGAGRLGANAGAGMRIRMGPRLALLAEARGFLFKKRRLVWGAAQAPGGPLEQALLDDVLQRLPAIELTPAYWRVAAGIGLAL